jgi:hypothetical protein
MDHSPFSRSYVEARARFRDAAARIGCNLTSQTIPGVGPEGELLTIDLADSGGDRSTTLVLSSGLHGVEGYFGSGVQIAFLDACTAQSPGVRCVLVHGLNPYGFAWRRRWNEDNIDLNRNFLLPGQSYQGAPSEYAALNTLLNPQSPPSRWDLFPVRFLGRALRHGVAGVKQAVASGQYEFPRGLFFGGTAPAATVLALRELLPPVLSGARRVVHFDYHTGLGAYGTHRLLLDVPLTSAQRERLTTYYGKSGFDECDDRSIAYEARGGFGPWCVAQGWAEDYLFACAEFGTHGPLRVLSALRTENQANWHTPAASPTLSRSRQSLLEAFCPADSEWRERTVGDGVQLALVACRMFCES